MARDFHLEDFVGERIGVDLGVGEEGDEAFLESAEAAFDFAFGLRGWGHEVGDAEGAQGALELAGGSRWSWEELGPKRLSASV